MIDFILVRKRLEHALAVAFLAVSLSHADADSDPWYKSYMEGRDAIAMNPAAAVPKLLAALQKEPVSRKDKPIYGGRSINYFPDYYLAKAYDNLGEYSKALEQCEKVLASNIFKDPDPLYLDTMSIKTRSERMLVQAKEKTDNVTQHSLPKPVQAQQQIDLAAQKQKAETDQLIQSTRDALAANKLDDAKRSLEKLKDKAGPDSPEFLALFQQVSLKERELNEIQTRIAKARDLISQRRFVEARDTLKSIQSKDPSNAIANQLLQQVNEVETDFNNAMKDANQSYAAGNFDGAQASGMTARQTQFNNAIADRFLNKVTIRRNLETAILREDWNSANNLIGQLTPMDPKDLQLKPIQNQIAAGLQRLKGADLERLALMAFYNGRYEDSKKSLENLASVLESHQQQPSPRMYFYLGCSNAALGLIKKRDQESLLNQARQQFAKVKALNPAFVYDKQNISPRILEVYESTR